MPSNPHWIENLRYSIEVFDSESGRLLELGRLHDIDVGHAAYMLDKAVTAVAHARWCAIRLNQDCVRCEIDEHTPQTHRALKFHKQRQSARDKSAERAEDLRVVATRPPHTREVPISSHNGMRRGEEQCSRNS
jgi:hypothetical protein